MYIKWIVLEEVNNEKFYKNKFDIYMTHENKRKNVRKKQRHSHKLNNQVQVQHHYNSTCGGKKSTATSLENAKARGLTPCKKCAQ